MNFRFTKIGLAISLISGAASAANNAVWNCEQAPNGEWTCLNQTPAQTPAAETNKPQAVLTEAKPKAEPVNTKSVIPTPQQTNPVADTQPLTSPVDLAKDKLNEPVAIKPAKPIEAVAAKIAEKVHVNNDKLQVKINEKSSPKQAEAETVASSRDTPGWNCKSGESKSWNCNLVGPDPQGEPRVAAHQETAEFVFNPTYSLAQEKKFQSLRAEFEQDPWRNCQNWSQKKRKNKTVGQAERNSFDTVVNSDASEIFEGDSISFIGNVDLHRADQHLMSDKANYDSTAETMDAQGNIIYSENQIALAGETASFNLENDKAVLRKALFITPEAPLRGASEVIYRDNKFQSRYQDASFTSCAPGNQDWMIHAERMKLNKDTGKGIARNAWLEFKGVPALYMPYISFPMDNRRVSGLLAPNWAQTQRNGADISIPYYWNMAPNYDMTITPRYLSRRGFMIRDRFRYLTDHSNGMLQGEYLPGDELLNKDRYMGSWKDSSRLTQHLSSDINLNYASDKTYFNDLNNALGVQTSSYLPTTAFVNYGRTGINVSTGIQHYQAIDRAVTETGLPYSVLPRVNMNLSHGFENLPLRLAMTNQFSSFSHNVLDNGQRVNVIPSVSLPFESTAGFFIPKFSLNYTQYQFDNIHNPLRPNDVTRTLPTFSVDTGLGFEKEIRFNSSSYTHTIEPRLFYLNVPYKDQSQIPVFDTSRLDTNFGSLFQDNRYSSYDRIQDANQVTLSLSSRLISSATGLEPVRLNLGNILYFQDRRVNMYDAYYGISDCSQLGNSRFFYNSNCYAISNPNPPQTSKVSNFIAEVGGQFTQNLSYKTGVQWDPQKNSFARGEAGFAYRNLDNEVLNVGYRYRQKDQYFAPAGISQSDISFRWPLFGEWYALGRWQYAINFDRTTESFLGLEKENCCWRFRMLARRYINGYAANTNLVVPTTLQPVMLQPETAFFVQVELKGLSGLGSSVDSFLQRNLVGYRKPIFSDE